MKRQANTHSASCVLDAAALAAVDGGTVPTESYYDVFETFDSKTTNSGNSPVINSGWDTSVSVAYRGAPPGWIQQHEQGVRDYQQGIRSDNGAGPPPPKQNQNPQ
jgi:hypothetical protein